MIDSLGNPGEISILRGVHKDLDNEVLRVVQLIKDWLPAIQNSKAVQSVVTIPVRFELKQ
jgi:outer membrane biosynthesis protein TonB